MKLLTFDMGITTYGIDILDVREIIGVLPVDSEKAIELRGQKIPFFDLADKLDVKLGEQSDETSMIVVSVDDSVSYFVTDHAIEVLESDVNDETGQAEVLDIKELLTP